MSKKRPDLEFRESFDQGYANANYASKKLGLKILIWILVLVVLSTALGFGVRFWNVNANRMIFKQSVTYNEGMLDDLAKYKLEIIKSDDDVERAAIAEMVNSRFANFDQSKIENKELKKFLSDCMNGKYNVKGDT